MKPGDRIVEVSGSRLQGEAAYQAMTGKGLYHVYIYGDDWGVVYGIVYKQFYEKAMVFNLLYIVQGYYHPHLFGLFSHECWQPNAKTCHDWGWLIQSIYLDFGSCLLGLAQDVDFRSILQRNVLCLVDPQPRCLLQVSLWVNCSRMIWKTHG